MHHDLGHGLPFRPGTFDGAISISAVQWLCNADRASHEPRCVRVRGRACVPCGTCERAWAEHACQSLHHVGHVTALCQRSRGCMQRAARPAWHCGPPPRSPHQPHGTPSSARLAPLYYFR